MNDIQFAAVLIAIAIVAGAGIIGIAIRVSIGDYLAEIRDRLPKPKN